VSTLEDKLLIYAEKNLNVMFIGTHGIGKSTIVKAIAEKIGLQFKYYSTSTLDPYAELIGVPVPDKDTKTLEFYRPKVLEEAEFIFFDELNRVQNPRILNAVLEIIQFKSINGEPLPHLKMVWAAINPPGDYQVEDLDPALVDRFHMYIRLTAHIDMDYMKTKMSEKVARVVKDWWDVDLSEEQQKILTPRRIEYIGWMIDNSVPWRDAVPQGHTFPVNQLEDRVEKMQSGDSDLSITHDAILSNLDAYRERVVKSPKIAIPLSQVMMKFSEEEMFKCRDIIESMPTELVNKLMENKWITRQRVLRDMFLSQSIDIAKSYPKIFKAFMPEVTK
jgi:hypothetical protein